MLEVVVEMANGGGGGGDGGGGGGGGCVVLGQLRGRTAVRWVSVLVWHVSINSSTSSSTSSKIRPEGIYDRILKENSILGSPIYTITIKITTTTATTAATGTTSIIATTTTTITTTTTTSLLISSIYFFIPQTIPWLSDRSLSSSSMRLLS
ncbi:hypothetical protein M0804_005296 [Polistes exclamans]|nr:hypothetical protein M0804_005296 [Polistes exclamans]